MKLARDRRRANRGDPARSKAIVSPRSRLQLLRTPFLGAPLGAPPISAAKKSVSTKPHRVSIRILSRHQALPLADFARLTLPKVCRKHASTVDHSGRGRCCTTSWPGSSSKAPEAAAGGCVIDPPQAAAETPAKSPRMVVLGSSNITKVAHGPKASRQLLVLDVSVSSARGLEEKSECA